MSAERVDLRVQVGPLELPSPLLVASGTFGFGQEYAQYVDLGALGGIMTKAVTIAPREGNPGPRVWETSAGMLNSIGLQNPGLDTVIAEKLPFLIELGVPIIVNIAGETIAEYATLAQRLGEVEGLAALEVNVSCPNVDRGGMEFCREIPVLRELVAAVRDETELPLIVKLSPNVGDVVPTAEAALEGGAEVVSMINTLVGMAIDAVRRRPRLAHVTGGLSGPAVKPIALAMVWRVWRALQCPVIGMGGIFTGEDAAEFLLAGASAVAVGTASFVDPTSAQRVREELVEFCCGQGVETVRELTGSLRV
ncbi:MAG: dihydroorotate dehydrogenase [Armatimonadota bacterium]